MRTFKGILSKEHKEEKDAKSPKIHRNTVIRICENLWCHVFLSSAVSFCSNTTDGSSKSKICNFVLNIKSIRLGYFLKQDVLRLNISVDEIFLMDYL